MVDAKVATDARPAWETAQDPDSMRRKYREQFRFTEEWQRQLASKLAS